MKKIFIAILFMGISLNSCAKKVSYMKMKLPDCTIMVNSEYEVIKGDKMTLIKPTEDFINKGYYMIQYLGKGLENLPKDLINTYNEPKGQVVMEHLRVVKIGKDPIHTEASFMIGDNFFIKYKEFNEDIGKIIDSCNATWNK